MCNVRHVSDVCKDLDHTTVTEYKKWLNNLRVSTIELKNLLGRCLDSGEQHKITALNELQKMFSKANENLNHAHLNLVSEIENIFNPQFSDLREKIAKIKGINDQLDNSLKDAGRLEGSRMDTKLFFKLLNAMTKYNIRTVPLELSTIGGELRKVNCSFIANNRYQPLSSRSKLGRIKTSIIKISPSKLLPTSELSHIFTKPTSDHALQMPRSETVSCNKTTQNHITLTSGDITESAKLVSTADKKKIEKQSTLKDFTAEATGEYAAGYAIMLNDQQNNDGNVGDDENINSDENQTVNGNSHGITGFSRQLTAENENIGRTVGESTINNKRMSATLKDVTGPAKQNKNNVVLLNGSPYVLVPYTPINAKCDKGTVVSRGSTQENNQSAATIICKTYNTLQITRLNARTKLLKPSNKNDVIEPQIKSQSDDQTKECIQMNTANCTHSQSASTDDKVCSDKRGSRSVTLQTKKEDNASQPIIQSVEISKSKNAKMDVSAYLRPHFALPTVLSHQEKTTYFDNCATINRDTIFEQHNSPPHTSMESNKSNTINSNSTIATKPSTEMHKQIYSNFDALITTPRGFPLPPQKPECIAVNNLQHNSNLCNNSGVPFDLVNRDAEKGTLTSNGVQTYSYAIDDGAATDLSQKKDTYNNVSDTAESCCFTVRKTEMASHKTEQQCDMLNTNCITYGKDNIHSHTGSHIHSLGNMFRDNANHINEAILSANNSQITYNLTWPSTAHTDVDNNVKTTTMVEHTMEMQRSKRALYTGLNVTSVRQIHIRHPSDKWKPRITGCVFLSDGRVILCDNYNKNLKCLDKSFTVHDRLDLPSYPWEISVVSDTTAIITLPEEKQLQYIEVTPRLKLDRAIQLDKACFGVHVVGSDIYITCRSGFPCDDGEVRILDKYGNFKRRLAVNEDKTFMFSDTVYLTVSERSNRIYVSDWGRDTITCMKPDGAVIFQYEDPELKGPAGLCVDDEDNVIVCDQFSQNIHIVTAAGGKRSVILIHNDGILCPRFVAYRRTDHTMIVGCFDNDNLFVINCTEK